MMRLPRIFGFIGAFCFAMFVLGASLIALSDDIIFSDGFENHPPDISSSPPTVVVINTLYSYDVVATDIDGDVLVYGLVVSPENMTIGEFSGEIRWTPDQLGVFAVEILVSDGNDGTTLQQWDIDVQAILDSDNDGLSDDDELAMGTDPSNPDTDDDGLKDGEEVNQYNTDPLDADTDNDGLNDGDEIKIHFTQPDNRDTDNDTYRDGEEIDYGSDPLDETDFPVNIVPADPANVAPEIDPTVATTVFGSTEFLYRGLHRVQTGVENDVMNPVRVAVMRGTVMNRDGTPLSGVLVTVHNHPEFGQTLSRANGAFDLAVNGGGLLTLDFTRDGFLSAQRQLSVPWQDYVVVPDVVLIPLDAQVTTIDLSAASPMQVAQGSTTTDDRGTRQATLLFPEGTQADLLMPDGSTQAISSLAVRATEYTVGPNGEQAMPARLPPGIGYTYAVEMSVDEAITSGAKEISFDQPVPNYLDNFLDFPTGAEIPAYFYDPERVVWVPSAPGRVIEIVSVTDDLADVDTNGDGLADGVDVLEALGITDAERLQLANLYPVGKTLWRARLNHFTAIDYNLFYDYPESDYPLTPSVWSGESETEDVSCQQQGSSVIECQNQTLGESIPIAGTPFSLIYRSDRTEGRGAAFTIDIPVKAHSCSGVRLNIAVAGQKTTEELDCSPEDQNYEFTWDGTDAYGRIVNGTVPVSVWIGYAYPARRCYRYWPEGASEWEKRCDVFPNQYDVLWSDQWQGMIGTFNSLGQGLGGWTLTHQHVYVAANTTLYRGDGGKRSVDELKVITTVAGDPDTCEQWNPWLPPVTNPCLGGLRKIDVGPDGSVYVPDINKSVVWRIAPDGLATIVAGTGDNGFNGDGIPATEANVTQPYDVALGPDGSLYITDLDYRIRRVRPDGIITTVAGNGIRGFSGDGGLATEASVNNVRGISVGPDGSLFLASYTNRRIRRVGTDGIITTVAGNGAVGDNGDGGPATEAAITPFDVEVGPDGAIYIASSKYIRHVAANGIIATIAGDLDSANIGDGGPATDAYIIQALALDLGPDGSLYLSQHSNGSGRVRKIDPDGIISTIGGNGSSIPRDDNLPSTKAGIYCLEGVSLGPDGAIYVPEWCTSRLRRVAPVLPGLSLSDFVIPSSSGSRLFVFDPAGRHLQTLNTLTGTVIYTFRYDSNDLLIQITDANGNTTQIERDELGNPTGIVGPYSQSTSLTLDGNGYLASISNPASERWQFSYTGDGLLTSSTNPNTHTSTYDYDNLGRLVQTLDAAGGGHTLIRRELEDGYEVSRTTKLGRTTAYKIQNLPTGDLQRTNTFPGGAESVTLIRSNGVSTSTGPEATTLIAQLGPDSRFGMQSPFPASLVIQTPGGINHDTSRSHETTLENTYDVMSLQTQTETLEINGQTYTTVFDAESALFTDTTPEGREMFTTLDTQGRVTERVIPGMEPVVFEYDSAGRLIRIARGSGLPSREFLFTYGSNGYLTEIEDPLSRTFSLSYDQAGKLISYTLPDTRTVQYGYDNLGNTTSIHPPGRSAHQFEYSPMNLQLAYLPPDLGLGDPRTSYAYTKDRHLLQADRPDGKTVNFSYDGAGHLSSVVIPRGTYSYTYIPVTGQLSTITAPDGGTLSLSYDATLITEATWAGVVPGTVSRTYGPGFQVISRSVNGDHQADMTYDNDRLLIQAGNLSLNRDLGTGRTVGTTLGNIVDARTFNGFGEIESYSAEYSGNSLMEIQYTRDKLGRITQGTEAIEGTSHVYDYVYDLAGRLVQVSIDSVVVSTYTYDANNNRLSFEGQGGFYAGTYDDQDRLLEYGDASYSYSLNGELSSKSIGVQTTNYTFDAIGNLVAVTIPGGDQVEYILDGVNRRIGKKVNGTLVQGFLYKDRVNPIVELDATGVVRSRFVYASSVHVPDYMIRDGITYRILSDHLGSPRLIVDVSTGAIAQQITYDEFGNILADTNPGFQPFGFAGGLYDPDTGLTRFGTRDYDPETGRWLAKDSSRFRNAETNLYEYVRGDPVNRIDPLGSTSQSASSTDQQLSSIPDLSWESLGQWLSDTARNITESQVVGAVAEALDMVGEIEFASQVDGYIVTIQGVINNVLDGILAVDEILNDSSQTEAEQGAGILICLRDRFTSLVGYTGGASGLYHEMVADMAIGMLEPGIRHIGRIREGHADRAHAAYAEGEN